MTLFYLHAVQMCLFFQDNILMPLPAQPPAVELQHAVESAVHFPEETFTEMAVKMVVEVDADAESMLEVAVEPVLDIPITAAIEVSLATCEGDGGEINASVSDVTHGPDNVTNPMETEGNEFLLGAVGGARDPQNITPVPDIAMPTDMQIVSVQSTSSDDPEVAVKAEYRMSASHHK